MNIMLPGLNSDKMSSSDEASNLEDTIRRRKVKKSFCEEGNKDDGLMTLFSHIYFSGIPVQGIEY